MFSSEALYLPKKAERLQYIIILYFDAFVKFYDEICANLHLSFYPILTKGRKKEPLK